jgi:hypothetical protein
LCGVSHVEIVWRGLRAGVLSGKRGRSVFVWCFFGWICQLICRIFC